MAFIRTKKIGKNSYAYVVENRWRKRGVGSRQKVGKYLGRVVSGLVRVRNSKNEIKFDSKKNVVMVLVLLELTNYGFKGNKIMSLHDLKFDLSRNHFVDKNGNIKRIVLELNEGFLCNHTLNKVLNFKGHGDDAREIGVELAKCFLEAGLKVSKEVFVEYYQKVI